MKYLFILLAPLIVPAAAFCCSDIFLTNQYSSVSARTMDMDCDLRSEVLIVPRHMEWSSENSGDIKGVKWTNKYGFAAVNTLGEKTVYCDGMNEAGLSAANLYLEETQYPVPKKGNNILAVMDLVSYLLGNFKSVDEVKTTLGQLVIWGNLYKPWQMVCKLHFILHDAEGKSLIIEWIDGKINLYEPEGHFCVLTNSPPYKQQLENALNSNPCSNDITKSADRFKFLYQLLGKFYAANTGLKSYLVPASEIIERAVTVRGEDKESEGNYFSTQFIVLRYHTERKFYIKNCNELNYKEFDINTLISEAKVIAH